MAKNLIPEIARMLGVELGEEFKVKGREGAIYKFIVDGLLVSDDDAEKVYTNANMPLVGLVRGDIEIVKLPWKPTMYEEYWTFGKLGKKLIVGTLSWREFPYEILLFDKGWVYRTRAEAEAALPKVAAEMGVEYESPTSDTEAVEPWKPKEGEFYYSFGIFAQTWGVSKICWLQHPFDFALLAKGWVYRTEAEAQAALPKVAAEMGVEYQL
nr:MAG TPA: hypothetical protein [Caudoviricetes sp.]